MSQHGSNPHAHDDGAVHAHVASTGHYVGIFAALIVLTFVTVGVSYYDFGAANAWVAVGVATVKASLVGLFFMHLLHDSRFNAVLFVGSFFFLGLFILFTTDDTSTRSRLDPVNGAVIHPVSKAPAPASLWAERPAAATSTAAAAH